MWAPGVRGGPTYREIQLCMEMIADTGDAWLRSMWWRSTRRSTCADRTAELGRVEFIQSLFGASTLAR